MRDHAFHLLYGQVAMVGGYSMYKLQDGIAAVLIGIMYGLVGVAALWLIFYLMDRYPR